MPSSTVELRRVVDRYAPLLVAVVVAVAVWESRTGALGVRTSLPGVLVLPIAVASGWAMAVVRTRRWPLFLAAAVGWLAMAAWPAGVVASYQAGLRLPDRRRVTWYLVGAVAVMAVGVLIGLAVGGPRRITTATPANAMVTALCLVAFPLMAGLLVRSRREVVVALRDRAERGAREREARAERVRVEERARIAREMHDVVAHRVSLIVVHAGALEVTATEPATVEAAALIRSTGRQALTDLREVLGVLRQPTFALADPGDDLLGGLAELLRESRVAGLRVRRQDEGQPRSVPPTVGRTVHRVVQEALTNVRKHAPEADATVHLRYLPGWVEIEVRNGPSAERPVLPNPRPGRPVAGLGLPGAGLGLVGLRERVELLGGRLEAWPTDGGFLVRALIPTPRPS
ncbi:sensor histidine kinase [Micromonospora avicenniae]|uniref:histidine kinase n=1 Tax=Micromonospora avicenniae TaxID=1198245 RepID=A0A1N6U7I2_9ACTN|nr:sensor histidine kinase [Micromonospora avicenniae]SIQ61520.1 Signal transduction histidine kinase [Micromonospora avicenniae]